MMKQGAIAVPFAALIFVGCATMGETYRTDTTVVPAGEPRQYEVKFQIVEVTADEKTRLVSAPSLKTFAGKPAFIIDTPDELGEAPFDLPLDADIMVALENWVNARDDVISCTALLTEGDSGLKVRTSVRVRAKGKDKLNTSQSISVKQ